jgi:hypothetical protein
MSDVLSSEVLRHLTGSMTRDLNRWSPHISETRFRAGPSLLAVPNLPHHRVVIFTLRHMVNNDGGVGPVAYGFVPHTARSDRWETI